MYDYIYDFSHKEDVMIKEEEKSFESSNPLQLSKS